MSDHSEALKNLNRSLKIAKRIGDCNKALENCVDLCEDLEHRMMQINEIAKTWKGIPSVDANGKLLYKDMMKIKGLSSK